jgi:hypothetical protein
MGVQPQLWMEQVAGNSPSSAAFSYQGGGRSSRNYFIGDDGTGVHAPVTNFTQLQNALLTLLGDVTPNLVDGTSLKRTPPLADPMYPWLFCESVGSVQGIGHPVQVNPDPTGLLEIPQVEYTALYPCYKFSGCLFGARPYTLLNDTAVNGFGSLSANGTPWYDETFTLQEQDAYANEWIRYVDVEHSPSGEFLVAQAGQFIFDVAGGYSPNGKPAGNGQLRMFFRKDALRITWYMVPYTFISSPDSFILEGIGHINQNPWCDWDKGQLLLEGIQIVRYTPIVPQMALWPVATNAYANNKYCNISFFMTLVNRPFATISDGGDGTRLAIPNDPVLPPWADDAAAIQIVQRHHNLVPWGHCLYQFFYAKLQNIADYEGAQGLPVYPSFPFELLFTNPDGDSPTPGGTL